MPGDGDELTQGVVFRFGVRSEQDMFYADKRKPLVGDFDIGSEEEKTARIKHYACLTVWDEELTTVDEARQFISPDRRLPIWLAVPDIIGLHSLRVIRRPHAKDFPGKEGHCEIENVWPSDKSTFRKIRSDLRDIATCDRNELKVKLK